MEVVVEVGSDLLLAGDDVLAHLGGALDPSGLLLEGGGVEDKGGEQLHAAVGAGHGEALVVGARDEERQGVGVAGGLDGELALRSAGDVEELDVLHELAGDLNGSEGLRAVAGAGEGHDQRGVLGAEEVARSAHDVGRGDGLEVVEGGVTGVTQVGSHGVADVVGSAGAGEDDGQTAIAHGAGIGQERLDGLEVLLVDVEGVEPELRLLLDLGGGDVGTERLEFIEGLLKH